MCLLKSAFAHSLPFKALMSIGMIIVTPSTLVPLFSPHNRMRLWLTGFSNLYCTVAKTCCKWSQKFFSGLTKFLSLTLFWNTRVDHPDTRPCLPKHLNISIRSSFPLTKNKQSALRNKACQGIFLKRKGNREAVAPLQQSRTLRLGHFGKTIVFTLPILK